jgi:hypothetical protein
MPTGLWLEICSEVMCNSYTCWVFSCLVFRRTFNHTKRSFISKIFSVSWKMKWGFALFYKKAPCCLKINIGWQNMDSTLTETTDTLLFSAATYGTPSCLLTLAPGYHRPASATNNTSVCPYVLRTREPPNSPETFLSPCKTGDSTCWLTRHN